LRDEILLSYRPNQLELLFKNLEEEFACPTTKIFGFLVKQISPRERLAQPATHPLGTFTKHLTQRTWLAQGPKLSDF